MKLFRLSGFFLVFVPFLVAQEETDPKTKQGSPPDGLKALQHPDAKVRYRAVETLAQLGPLARFAVPQLRELLKDRNPYVRIKATEALWKIDKTPGQVLLPVLLQALKDKDPEVRAAAPAVIALLGAKARSALPALVKALEDPDFDVKLAAIVAVGDFGPLAKSAAEDLIALSSDRDFPLLEPFVGAALANLGPAVLPTLTGALADLSAERRRVAIYALGSMGSGAARAAPALTDCLKHADAMTRKQAAVALGKIGKEARPSLSQLEALLSDKDATVQTEAVVAAWLISGEARHVDVLLPLLGHESTNVRDVACQGLARMHAAARPAVDPLMMMLQDRELRLRAITTLGEIGPPAEKAVPELKKCFKDKDGDAQLSAAFAVWQITRETSEILPIIEKGLASATHDRQAIRLLGEMGPAAARVLPTLAELYREEEMPSYRQLLADAIRKIDPQAAGKLGIR